MTDVLAGELAPPHECPICLKPLESPHQGRLLFNVTVCKKCRNRFAGLREAAWLVDNIAFLVVAMVTMGLGLLLTRTTFPGLVSAMGIVSGFAGLPLVFALKDAARGRSPGKWLFNLQVVDAGTHEPIGAWQSFKRNLLLVIPVRPVALITTIGSLVTLHRGQRWGEKWANTKVIWLRHKYRLPFAPDDRYCRQCGYDLTGNISGRCPECGRDIDWLQLLPEVRPADVGEPEHFI